MDRRIRRPVEDCSKSDGSSRFGWQEGTDSVDEEMVPAVCEVAREVLGSV